MKAAYIDEVGPPIEIRYGELPEPAVGPSDVLCRFRPWRSIRSTPTSVAASLPMKLPRPFIIGRDMVGRVERVGAAVQPVCPRRSGLVQQPGL